MNVTEVGIDLAQWARPSGYSYTVESETGIEIATAGGEVRWYLRDSDDRVIVSSAERSEIEYTRMATDQLVDAQRYLTFTLGHSLRKRIVPRAPIIRMPWNAEGIAEGFAVEPWGEDGFDTRVLEAGRERALFSDDYEAVWFTQYANVAVPDLRASLLDATGNPALAAFVEF